MDTKVLIAEDHAIVVKGIRMIFDTAFRDYQLDAVADSKNLMRTLKRNNYQLLIMDLHLADGDAYHLVGDIIRLYPDLSVLIFSSSPEELYAASMYVAGVKGYLNKLADDEEIIRATRQVLTGKSYVSEAFKLYLLDKIRHRESANPVHKLTLRQLEVANLLKKGIKPSEIGKQLNMQPSTVATFKMKIFSKLNISNIIELKEIFENINRPEELVAVEAAF